MPPHHRCEKTVSAGSTGVCSRLWLSAGPGGCVIAAHKPDMNLAAGRGANIFLLKEGIAVWLSRARSPGGGTASANEREPRLKAPQCVRVVLHLGEFDSRGQAFAAGDTDI